MRWIISLLASLTLTGCWLLNGPGGFRSSDNDAEDGNSADTTADTDGAGDTGNMEGADEGFTNEGSAHADAPDPTVDTVSPQGDPCQKLTIIAGIWFRADSGKKMEVSLEEEGNTCAVTTKGEGSLSDGGTYYGTQFPLKFDGGGWENGLYIKDEDRLIQMVKPPNLSPNEKEFYR